MQTQSLKYWLQTASGYPLYVNSFLGMDAKHGLDYLLHLFYPFSILFVFFTLLFIFFISFSLFLTFKQFYYVTHLDVNVQYVTHKLPWFLDSLNKCVQATETLVSSVLLARYFLPGKVCGWSSLAVSFFFFKRGIAMLHIVAAAEKH